ncbi:hypothetical protein Sango_2824100 [Sesamum angolense]|uniref:MULE transposase domain-containing protein n=1 Tax=Sesamum angolense TaxID=2727404 RepID=A0AAE1T6P7_9LAMI|nr:hypothetical protein Sango_2824100 [Sesamum angolense]
MHLEYIEDGTKGGLINNVVIEEGNESDMNASEDEDLFYDFDFNLSDDDMFFDDFVDPNVEFGGSNKGKFVEGGRHRGQLLSAVGLDANNNIYPIAYAIVESETKDSWMWFLRLLDRALGFENDQNWTFMSDKQKCLIPAFEALFPNAKNRQPPQASASNEPAQNRGIRQKLPLRMPPKNKQAKPTMSTRIASVKINQSTSNIHTLVIVRCGMNFINLSNLRASFSNTATENTSKLAFELPPGVSRSTSRVPSNSSKAFQSSQQG